MFPVRAFAGTAVLPKSKRIRLVSSKTSGIPFKSSWQVCLVLMTYSPSSLEVSPSNKDFFLSFIKDVDDSYVSTLLSTVAYTCCLHLHMQGRSSCANCAVLIKPHLPAPCSAERVKSSKIAPDCASHGAAICEMCFCGTCVFDWQHP